MLCTLLTEERHGSLTELPRSSCLASNAGDPGEEGEPVHPGKGSTPGKGAWFTQGAGISGMWPPWGTAWVGLFGQRSLVSLNNRGSAGHFIRLYLAH